MIAQAQVSVGREALEALLGNPGSATILVISLILLGAYGAWVGLTLMHVRRGMVTKEDLLHLQNSIHHWADAKFVAQDMFNAWKNGERKKGT
jgi:hypothetical protein